MTRFALALALLTLPVPALAQWVVYDPANVIQTTLTADRMLRQLEQLRRQYETLERVAGRLGHLDDYRTEPFAAGRYDIGRPGAELLAALNDGDEAGSRYRAVVSSLPVLVASHVPAAARFILDAQHAALDVMDAISGRTVHEAGALRGAMDDLARATAIFERDVLRQTEEESVTAVLDKIAGGGLLQARQSAATHALVALLVEHALAQTMRTRQTEAEAYQMRVGQLNAPRVFASEGGSIDWTWRQP